MSPREESSASSADPLNQLSRAEAKAIFMGELRNSYVVLFPDAGMKAILDEIEDEDSTRASRLYASSLLLYCWDVGLGQKLDEETGPIAHYRRLAGSDDGRAWLKRLDAALQLEINNALDWLGNDKTRLTGTYRTKLRNVIGVFVSHRIKLNQSLDINLGTDTQLVAWARDQLEKASKWMGQYVSETAGEDFPYLTARQSFSPFDSRTALAVHSVISQTDVSIDSRPIIWGLLQRAPPRVDEEALAKALEKFSTADVADATKLLFERYLECQPTGGRYVDPFRSLPEESRRRYALSNVVKAEPSPQLIMLFARCLQKDAYPPTFSKRDLEFVLRMAWPVVAHRADRDLDDQSREDSRTILEQLDWDDGDEEELIELVESVLFYQPE